MTIEFSCPGCGKKLGASESQVGRQRKCPNCGSSVTIPVATAKQGIETVASPAAPGVPKTPVSSEPAPLFARIQEDHGNLIDMTAMVDIVFFLLIFFLVTSMESLQAVINLPAPEASEGSANVQTIPDLANDPSLIVVTIDDDDAVWVEDEEALSEPDLRAKLRAAARDGEREGMLIQGAGNATHGKFVMVLDAGADAGMKEIMFSVEESEALDEAG